MLEKMVVGANEDHVSTKSPVCKPVRFVLENRASSGFESRTRGRKSIDTTTTDKQSRRRMHQRAYRERRQQHVSVIEGERDRYCKQVLQLQRRLRATSQSTKTALSILQDLEKICSTSNLPLQHSTREMMENIKANIAKQRTAHRCEGSNDVATDVAIWSRRESAGKDAAVTTTKTLGQDILQTSKDTDTTYTHPDETMNPAIHKPYIPRHTALYYLQTQALLKQSEQSSSKGKSALDSTFLEVALNMNDQAHVNFKCLPSQSLRERILLFQDIVDVTKLVNNIIKGGICWGLDPLDTASWEMPEILFQDYWFICDEDLVRTTNKWRLMHGRSPVVWDSSGRHVKEQA